MSLHARFRVDHGAFVLDVDLQLPERGVTSLFGPSGCGKTTFLRSLAGLERHPGAYLRVRGEVWQDDTHFVPPHRRPIGYVFQEASLFEHLNVQGNLEYGLRRLDSASKRVSLTQAVELLEIGSILSRRPQTLSGGERQRVAIARALAVSPDLLLMDEPLAAVDIDRRREILPYLESLHRELDIPVIHVSHFPDEVARFADHVVLMAQGKVVASGAVHETFTRLDLSLAHADNAASLIEAEVDTYDSDFGLTYVDSPAGRFALSQAGLEEGRRVRLSIAARDVSLTLVRQRDTSILNIVPAIVEAIMEEDAAQATVRLKAGGIPLLARITRKSAHDLALRPGCEVHAQVKSIALLS